MDTGGEKKGLWVMDRWMYIKGMMDLGREVWVEALCSFHRSLITNPYRVLSLRFLSRS